MSKHIGMLDLRREYEHMKESIDAAIRKCLDHQKWILGPEVRELEQAIAKYLGVRHCIGISSGTDALVVALRALAIKTKGKEYFDPSDEIITTPFTFTATGDAILRARATPVFVDIDPATYNIDPEQIRQYLKQSTRVVGIVPVHLYGQSCRMDDILSIAADRKLFVLEDVAQAFGGDWHKKKLGSMGNAGAFSFFPSKNLGGFGDGGMMSTDDDTTAELARMLLKHGGKDKYNVDHIGYNARLDTLHAAILLAKFAHLDDFNARRRAIAESYRGLLKGAPVAVPETIAGAHHVFHQYTIRIRDEKRDKLQKHLSEKGIDTMVYYPFPLHKMKVFHDRCILPFALPHTESVVHEVLSLPVEPLQENDDTQRVAREIGQFFKQ